MTVKEFKEIVASIDPLYDNLPIMYDKNENISYNSSEIKQIDIQFEKEKKGVWYNESAIAMFMKVKENKVSKKHLIKDK